MTRTKKVFRRFYPWVAAIAGLLLGVFSRQVFRNASAGDGDGAAGRPARLTQDAASSKPLPSGPTSARIRAIADAGAAECMARVLEILDAGQAGMEIELEALFRRWLSFETPDEILSKLDPLQGRQDNDWNAAFFNAWAALDERRAMADTKHSRFDPARALFAIRNAHPDFARHLARLGQQLSLDGKAGVALTSLARDRPDLARSVANADLPAAVKSKSITAVARGMAMNDPEAALAWLGSIDSGSSDAHLVAVFTEWLRSDPEAAILAKERLGHGDFVIDDRSVSPQLFWAMSHPESAAGRLSIALHGDPFIDPSTLHQQLSALEIDWENTGIVATAINQDGWYGVAPAADAAKALELPPGKARDFIMTAICQNWAAHDPEAALRFADAHGIPSRVLDNYRKEPSDEMRRTVFSNPQEHFAALAGGGGLPEGMSGEQLYSLAMEWSAADPVGVANWLVTRNTPSWFDPNRPHANMLFSNTIGHHWAGNDPLGASRWMEEVPEGPLQARTWKAMEDYVSRYSPDFAFALSAAYLNDDSRLIHLSRALEEVRKNIGHPAALELLKSPDLSPDENRVLAESLEATRRGNKQ
jgi:hypothetical protein